MLVSKLKMQSLIICPPSQLMRNEMLQHKTEPKCKNFRKNTSFSDNPHYNEDSFVQSWVLPMQQALLWVQPAGNLP